MIMESFVDVASWWVDVLTVQSVNVSVIFVAVLLVGRLVRRRGPALHLVLWSLVFVRLALPPGLSHAWSAGAMIDRLSPSALTAVSHAPDGIRIDAVGSAVEIGAGGEHPGIRREPTVLAVLWLLGALTAFVTYGRRLAPFHEQIRSAPPVTDPTVLALAERWRRRLRVRRQVRVVTSSARISPFTLGVLRPVIFLPQPIAADRRSVEPVIAHEMAHVARWDALWLGLQHLAQAAYFFHPLVWFAGARLDMERERLCDATVVATGRLTARDYVGGLLTVLQLDPQGAGAPTMTARKRRIDVRIRNIFERDGARRPRLAAAVAVAFAVGVFLLPLGGGDADEDVQGGVFAPQSTIHEASDIGAANFTNPLPGGRVTWTWGPGHLDPWTKKETFHRGIDVAAKAGTPVLAPADGVVIVATESFDESPGSGTVIMVDHGDGWTTFYAHLGSLDVTAGQRVVQLDVIATVGSTGKSTGPHLHFEVRRNGDTKNPADYVTDWQ